MIRKKDTATAGSSGSGKTYCVAVLGDLLQIQTLIIDATNYTEYLSRRIPMVGFKAYGKKTVSVNSPYSPVTQNL